MPLTPPCVPGRRGLNAENNRGSMGHYCRHCGRMRSNEQFSGRGHAMHICKACVAETKRDQRAKARANALYEEAHAQGMTHDWLFTRYLHHQTLAEGDPARAVTRLREAVAEIRTVAATQPLVAGEGIIELYERLVRATRHDDSCARRVSMAIADTVQALCPVLRTAPADAATRGRWVERLVLAIRDDEAACLLPVEERWPDLVGDMPLLESWLNRLLPDVRTALKRQDPTGAVGAVLCLSSLLALARYRALKSLLDLLRQPCWSYHRYWAEALLQQEKPADALAWVEAMFARHPDPRQQRWCEDLLIALGREEEGYQRYGIVNRHETTYLARYRALVKTYPTRERRQLLRELMERAGAPRSVWFATARQAGFLDMALDCAHAGAVDPRTLSRAAHATVNTHPAFAVPIALLAVAAYLRGEAMRIQQQEIDQAVDTVIYAATTLGSVEATHRQLQALHDRPGNVRVIQQMLAARLAV